MHATTSSFCDNFERDLGIPKPTSMQYAQRLREDESLFRKGKRGLGALDLTTAEVANWVIALCAATATTRKIPNTIKTVKLARAAVRLRNPDLNQHCPPGALDGLAMDAAETFGEALESLLNDMRSGAYTKWAGSHRGALIDIHQSHIAPPPPYDLRIRFINHGSQGIVINTLRFSPRRERQEAVLVFRGSYPHVPGIYLTHTHEIHGFALEALAETLGPFG